MSLDKDTVRNIARLARIKVAEDDLDHLASELNNILGWVEQLAEVNTDGVAPMTSAVEMRLRWREDEINDGGQAAKVTGNAPAGHDHYFTVPKVVE